MNNLFFCQSLFLQNNIKPNLLVPKKYILKKNGSGDTINIFYPLKFLNFKIKNKKSKFQANFFLNMNSKDFQGEEKKDQDISGDGGVIKNILKEGNGSEIKNGFQVKLNYEGKLIDGRIFDSSLTRKKPFSFRIGEGKVISGWEMGIKSMKVGEKAKFFISSKYGYKKKGIPPIIPPNADLFFEIEILDITEPEEVEYSKKSFSKSREIGVSDKNYEPYDAPTLNQQSNEFFFISPFSSQTGEKAPWWLNPNITFFLIFLLIIFLFSIVYLLGGINHSFDNPSSILDSDD